MPNVLGIATMLQEGTGVTIDTTEIVNGMTSGTQGMLDNFLGMVGDMLPVALPVLGVTIGIGFCIGLIRRFV